MCWTAPHTNNVLFALKDKKKNQENKSKMSTNRSKRRQATNALESLIRTH